ncbi:MAG: CPXCG motif-containing cysteine-rich protein [Pseudomonadota bacterium]
MNGFAVEEVATHCPYCGEPITVLVEPETVDVGDGYVEDCQVCCRPMMLFPHQEHDGTIWVDARQENEC